ncbi:MULTISPECIES: hypothetical protein [Fischerella]|uniref:hypothetical protein n=1 Tax=Fischerella TaxID=1190 RepID=UPI0011AF6BFB|nr:MULTISPECIES: hypothetical protein [Fischerella]MBD2433941.1 hypothetical protein [Fischerella sp. FACHB-380]
MKKLNSWRSWRLGESTCRLGGLRHDGKVANPEGGLFSIPILCNALFPLQLQMAFEKPLIARSRR